MRPVWWSSPLSTRLSESFEQSSFQPLWTHCHAAKTADEPHSLENDVLASHFERHVWDAYVGSPRPPPLIFQKRIPEDVRGLLIADVKRCRRNALYYNVHDIPVFCPLDDVTPCDFELGDIVCVTKKYKNFIAQYG